MSRQLELPFMCRGEAPKGERSAEARPARREDEGSGASDLLERVLMRANLKDALARVRRNKGGPGADGMRTEELAAYLRENWARIREQLLAGTYQPEPVKRQEIPKSGGGLRQLGIPTVLDRFIQQALLQVLQPIMDPGFSMHSYGFRPGRSAHQALHLLRERVGQPREAAHAHAHRQVLAFHEARGDVRRVR